MVDFNLPFTLSSVELASKVGCFHWIGLGSQAEYGNHCQAIDEKTPIDSVLHFAGMKSVSDSVIYPIKYWEKFYTTLVNKC